MLHRFGVVSLVSPRLKGLLLCGVLLGCSLAACTAEQPPPPKPPEPPAPTAVEVPPAPPPTPDIQRAVLDAVNAPDREEDDLALDAGRQPQRLLTFLGVAPGMRVAELGAGGGYTVELLARIVGPDGAVYGQNSPLILERFAEGPWSKRLLKPVMGNVKRLDQEFDAPFPPEARDLDMVLMVLFYHDTVWQGVNREAMNKNVFDALESGGIYGIIDHSGREGSGTTETESLHRIEESVVKAEVEKAGFVLQDQADFLRNPDDTRDWSASPRTAGEQRGTSDRFVLRFVKP